MLKVFQYIFLVSLVLISCKEKNENQEESLAAAVEKEQAVPVYDFEGFEPYLHKENDTIYIVNFWATWCKPCVKELPYFESMGEEFAGQNVKVLLVSLDFSEKLESHVLPFIEKHQLKSQVILLDDVDSNTWIPKVDESWSGAIPATLIYSRNERKFYEGSFTYDELLTELNTFLQ